MPINPALQFAVDLLNKRWNKCGSVRVLSWDEYAKTEQTSDVSYAQFLEERGIDFMPAPGCIVVDFDFADDELDEQERVEFQGAMETLWNAMAMQGVALYGHDGSGGGLYYGLSIYSP